jgi:hypothetical protein
MHERRKSPRHRVFKGGTIAFNRAAAISCIVRNVSATGACLQVEAQFGIPASFDLVIATARASRRCDVVWRTEHHIGVAFSSGPPALASAIMPSRGL